MSIVAPTVIVKGFAIGGDKSTIPNSPVGLDPGEASYTLGFPPATRTPVNMGGVPPFGVDANGILYDATSNIAWLQGGGQYQWNASFVAENTGYAIGAVLQSSGDPWIYWYNRSANNANNPDVSSAGWSKLAPNTTQVGAATIVAAAGTTNNLVIPAGVSVLDFDLTAGNATITGIVAEFDGQELILITGHVSNQLTLTAEDAGSSAANRFRIISSGLLLLQNLPVTIKWYAALNRWVQK